MSATSYQTAYPKQGCALVFVNDKFHDNTYMDYRNGAAKDIAYYKETFEKCGLEVYVYENKTLAETVKILQTFAVNPARTTESMMAVAFSTHGDQMKLPDSDDTEVWADALYCTDKLVRLSLITKLFTDRSCTGMAGKPKLFFVQACRGQKLDETVKKETGSEWEPTTMSMPSNSENSTVEIPIFKDFYVAYAAPPGYMSFRSPRTGSWFVKCLRDVIVDNVKDYDLVSLLTMVCNKVAMSDEACVVKKPPVDQPYLRGRKIAPWTLSMLTKDVWFKELQKV